MNATINASGTWKQFQADNADVSARDLQNAWAELCKERQASMKARYEAATSGVTFKRLGRIATTGKSVGKVKLAAIRLTVATAHELEAQRLADAERSAKKDAAYAQLIAEAK